MIFVASGAPRPAWEVFRDSTREDVRAVPCHGGPLHGRIIRWPVWMTASHQEGGVDYVYGWERRTNRMELLWANTIPAPVQRSVEIYNRYRKACH